MAEHLQQPKPPQDEQNEELLRGSELGVILAEVYREATSIDPRLKEMKIVPLDEDDETSYAFARSKDVSESGKHEVHIRLGKLDDTLSYYAEAMSKFPDSIAIIAERLHVEPADVTPQLLFVHSILHEMGHVVDHMDYEDDMDTLRLRNKIERDALPLGYVSLTKLMDPTSPLRQKVERHWDEIAEKHGVETIDDLARIQGKAYRYLTAERAADSFAAKIFEGDPQLISQLIHGDIENYRDFPVVEVIH